MEIVASADRDGQPLALLLFDIDRFKQINDTCGHAVGDQLLVAVGQAIRARLTPADLFARHGGDEFLIAIRGDRVAEIHDRAEGFRDAIVEAGASLSTPLSATGSFGLVIRQPRDAIGWDELVQRADHALYASKRAGRNRVTAWTPRLNLPFPLAAARPEAARPTERRAARSA